MRIPNVLQNLLGEGVLSASFIPVYSRLLADEDEEQARRVAGAVAGLLAALSGVIVLVTLVAARPITRVLAFGLRGETFELTVRLVRVVVPGIGFLVLSAWCLGVLNSHRRFFLPYVAPVVWNAAQIAVLAWAAVRDWDEVPIAEVLAWAVLVGGLLQFAVQLPAIRRVAPHVRPTLDVASPASKLVISRFGPAVLGRGVVQLSAYLDLMLASLLAAGAIAAVASAQVLYLLPVALFGISVAAAELPELSRIGERDIVRLTNDVSAALRRMLFFVLFCTAAYVAVGDLIVGAIFERGAFGPDDTRLVWIVLGAYSLGLPAITASRLLQNALYALGDVRGPAAIAAIRVALATAFGLFFMFQLDRVFVFESGISGLGDLPAPLSPLREAIRINDALPLRMGAAGLAIGAAIGAWVELGLLRQLLGDRTNSLSLGGRQLRVFAIPLAAAAGAMFVARPVVASLPALIAAPLALALGGAIYLFAAARVRITETELVLAPLRRRWSRVPRHHS